MFKSGKKGAGEIILIILAIVAVTGVIVLSLKIKIKKNFKVNNFQETFLSENNIEKSLVSKNNKEKLNKNSPINNRNIVSQEMKIFQDNFSKDKIVEEAGDLNSSRDENWWVNSGAFLYVKNGVGQTIFGKLKKDNKWQKDYYDYNKQETDNGYRPQNIFRLITKSRWRNLQQEVYFNIQHYELSPDKHRSESNGFLLFNRYQDGDNLYYTGLRVDGAVVVKKKYKGKYYLLGYKKILKGKYDRKKKANLIPQQKWLGLKSEVRTIKNNQVTIQVFVKLKEGQNNWQKILSVKDDGKKYGGPAILNEGYAGIRTDFMDVKFDNYKIRELKN